MKNIAPYLINAHINWIIDSGLTPLIVLKNSDKTKFPKHLQDHLQDQVSITFNISDTSVTKFMLDEFGVSFNARFNGVAQDIIAPLDCILSIQSDDGSVNIPINTPTLPESTIPIVAEKVKLSIIQGDNIGDGIPSGKLSLV